MAKKKITTLTYSQPLQPLLKAERTSFYNVPDSPATNLVLEALGAGADIADLPARKKQVSHGTSLEVLEDGRKRKIISTAPKAQITLEFADIEKITGNNKPAKKLFVLALIKANEQAIFNGELGRDYISFPLQELVDIGFYSTIQSARNGFKKAMDALTDIKISGEIERTKKHKVSVIGLHPFRVGYIDKNQCYIQLESNFNWSFVAQYFTILPRYYFKLPNRASDLLYYIFYLARMNTKKIEEQGYFTISFRAIQHRLQLPNEKGLNNPQRDIKDAIEDAIEQLETEHSKTYGNMEFSLLPVYDEEAPIAEYLDNGYLKVELKGAFASTFIAISKDTEKQIADYQKRTARITEKAIAINTAKKLENAERSVANAEN
jgi:hypothetical protein